MKTAKTTSLPKALKTAVEMFSANVHGLTTFALEEYAGGYAVCDARIAGVLAEIATAEMARREPPAEVELRAYDVLEINRGGKWMDFSTIRADDFTDARRILANGFDGTPAASFRVRKGFNW